MSLSENIKKSRTDCHLTQIQLAEKLTQALGTKVTNTSISNWEKGINQPDIDTILELCKILNKDANYFLDWENFINENNNLDEVINLYKSLNLTNQTESINYMKYLKNKQDNNLDNSSEASEELFVLKNKVQILGQTAAGKPLEYSDTITEDINNLSDVPANADFALTVKGDSMEPEIKNGSIIYIHSQEDVENGTISIVEIDGAVTCKKVYKKDNQLKLVSLNEKYEPMLIDKGNVRILGKVIL